jgi:catechol 2,3-dioxygenase-like lactoylglutathione lyase family enzyme
MNPRPPINQQVTFLYTADLAQTAVFYETILQLPLILDQGTCRIYATGGNSYLGFCQHLSSGSAHPDGLMITLVTSDVDGWHAYLQAHQIPIEKPPTYNANFNIYQLFVRDPNGYLLEIQTFMDPTWPQPNQSHP